jgi:hypothetical protein
MALQKLLAGRLPEPPAEAPTVASTLSEIYHMPVLAPVRFFWEALYDMRPWWPVLLPLLAWVGWRNYRRERTKVLARRNKPSS